MNAVVKKSNTQFLIIYINCFFLNFFENMKEPCRKMPVLFNETPVGFFEGFGIMKTDGSLTRIFFPIPGTGGSLIPVPPLKYPEPGGAFDSDSLFPNTRTCRLCCGFWWFKYPDRLVLWFGCFTYYWFFDSGGSNTRSQWLLKISNGCQTRAGYLVFVIPIRFWVFEKIPKSKDRWARVSER